MCRWQPFYFYFLFSKFVLPLIQHAILLPSNGAPDLSPSKTSEAVTFFALLSASDLNLLLRFTPKWRYRLILRLLLLVIWGIGGLRVHPHSKSSCSGQIEVEGVGVVAVDFNINLFWFKA